MAHSQTANLILDSAERMARKGGYNGFSFREIAAEIGIKAASVHYHFPNKESLGAALAERYTERFLAGLETAHESTPEDRLTRYSEAYRRALQDDGLMCLCGMFGAEICDLPVSVAGQTRMFFERNILWLQRVFQSKGSDEQNARIQAAAMIATLEGAMILSQSLQDDTLFDQIVAGTG